MAAPHGDHVAADASLHLLADHLADALAAGELSPCLVHVGTGDADGFDLGVLPLEGRHPTELLLGWTAPPEWHAVGMATSGWAYHVAERSSPHRRRHRVHVVSLLSRTGEHAHRTATDDPSVAPLLGDELPVGEQVDLLRRVLGLPTDPPPVDASAYWSIQWLADLVGAAQPVPSLGAALDAHPAMRLLRHGVRSADADVEDVLAAFHRVLTWSRLRQLAADGRFEVPDLLPQDSAWLDDGAFARFVLNRCPPLHVLRARLAAHLSDDVAVGVLDVLERLEVPECAWPDALRPPAA
ncbi:MAG TPA: hypothetical protein VFV42_06830 [Acidimicrobiales bacterium]|nr:hypothetical protein [Acidimicrobiales bacterium]